MPDQPQPQLEARLVELAGAIAYPATPPLAALIGARLREPRPRFGLGRPLGRGAALALAATLLLVGIAAAFGIGLGGQPAAR